MTEVEDQTKIVERVHLFEVEMMENQSPKVSGKLCLLVDRLSQSVGYIYPLHWWVVMKKQKAHWQIYSMVSQFREYAMKDGEEDPRAKMKNLPCTISRI